MYNRINFDERYDAQCFNHIIGQTFGRSAKKYTGRFRVIAPRVHLKMHPKTPQNDWFFSRLASEKFQKKLIKICDKNQYQKTVDLSVGKNSKNGKNSNLREI